MITTCTQGGSCQQLLCGADGWGWHLLRRKSGLDAETKGQVCVGGCCRHSCLQAGQPGRCTHSFRRTRQADYKRATPAGCSGKNLKSADDQSTSVHRTEQCSRSSLARNVTAAFWPNQVIDAVLRRHGVGCMLDWVESDLVLKEKTTNIQASKRSLLRLVCW